MSRPIEVRVLATGVANLASVHAALERLGATHQVASDPEQVRSADRLILPGVGAFAAGMTALRPHAEALAERIAAGRPTLAICLGLQLLGESSEESPGVAGLAIIPEAVRRFSAAVRVPHFGWSRIEVDGEGLLESGHAYFAHSFRFTAAPSGWRVAWADHGGRFVAAIERGSVLACQFHPELSGKFGSALIARWLACGL